MAVASNKDNLVHVDYDMYPFRDRFTNSHRFCAEVGQLIVVLNEKIAQLKLEIKEKKYIKACLASNFTRIELVLQQMIDSLKESKNLSNKTKKFESYLIAKQKTFEAHWQQYCYDQQQYEDMAKVRPFTVTIEPISSHWMCLNLKTKPVTAENNTQRPASPKKLKTTSADTNIEHEVMIIKAILRDINKHLERLSLRVTYLDECISWLFVHSKRPMKSFLMFLDYQAELDSDEFKQHFFNVSNAIRELFEIEHKIYFSGEPIDAYHFKAGSIYMKIIPPR